MTASHLSPSAWGLRAWSVFLVFMIGIHCPLAWAETKSSPANSTCRSLSQATPFGHWRVDLDDKARPTTLMLPPNRSVVIEAAERGVDVTLDVVSDGRPPLQADNPVRRSGVQRVVVQTGSTGVILVTAQAKARGGGGKQIDLSAVDADAGDAGSACRDVVGEIVAADAAYARGQLISDGKLNAPAGAAADAYETALRQYEQAFAGVAPDAKPFRAELAHAIAALLYQDLKQWRESAHWAERAASLFETAGDVYGRARAQALQAAAWIELATIPNANTAPEAARRDSQELFGRTVKRLRILASFHESRGEYFDAALQRNNIGIASYYAGAYTAAIAAYGRAVALYRRVGYDYGVAQVTQNKAVVERDLGRVSDALADYQLALRLLSVKDSHKLYADVLNNAGLANRTAGHLDLALEQHSQALELATKLQSPRQQARSLFGIALVDSAAGDRDQAAQFLQQALATWADNPEPRSEVGGMRALALIEAQEGRPAESIRLDRAALDLATDPGTRIRLLVQIAEAESLLARNSAAHTDLALARQIGAGADPVSRAVVDLERGVLEFREGNFRSARTLILSALTTDRAFGLDAPTFDATLALARLEAAAGRSTMALHELDKALKLSEAIRLQASDPELRATSMEPLRPAFDLEVTLLIAKYHQAVAAGDQVGATRAALAALGVTERSRARVLQDIAAANYEHTASSPLGSLLSRKSDLIREIAVHEDRLETGRPQPIASAIRDDMNQLRAKLAMVDSKLAILGGSQSPPVRSDDPVQSTQIPTDAAIISYWLGDTQSYAWILTRTRTQLVSLGPTSALAAAAQAAHEAFDNLNTTQVGDRLRADAQLSALAVRPLLPFLSAQVTRLVVIPDGALHYISFAVLPLRPEEGETYLIGKYEVAYGPSIGWLLHARPTPVAPEDRMLLVADAIYSRDDPRLPTLGAQLPAVPDTSRPQLRSAVNGAALERLPASAEEATNIERAALPTVVDRLEGAAATRDAVLARTLDRYRYIHFAVHATTDAIIPQLSSLVLSTYDAVGRPIESRIWAGDLMTLRFNARSLVLSACNTALGANRGGEGLLGLRYVALARGAQSVVASLWQVPDRTTALLMEDFYQGLLKAHLRPETALTVAMRQSLQRKPSDPALWGGFTPTIASLRSSPD
jgi:CHAT domain-containing protein